MAQDNDPNALVTERVERRLQEECGRVRLEVAGLRTEVAECRGEMRADMGDLRGQMSADLGDLRGQMRADLGDLRGQMRADLGGLRAEMIAGNTALLKWLLAFFVTQTAAIAAFIRLFR